MNDATQYLWMPPSELVAQSNLTAFLRTTGHRDYDDLAAQAETDPAWLMQAVFNFCDVRFYRPYDQMLDLSRGQPWARWCVGGTTNIVLNCIDRHRDTTVWDQTFLVWEGEDRREQRSLSYRAFDAEVGRLARGLSRLGIGRGHVVAIYMPNLPETFIAFFSILKLGAIVMPLFSGFGPAPLQTRLNHGEARAVITASGTWRRGTAAPLKSVLDAALDAAPSVRHAIVFDRGLELETPMRAGRDHFWHDVVAGRDGAIATAEMQAEDRRSCSTPRAPPASPRDASGPISASSARWSPATSSSAAISGRPTVSSFSAIWAGWSARCAPASRVSPAPAC